MSKYQITEVELHEELNHESEVMEQSRERYLQSVQRLSESGMGGITSVGSVLLKKIISPYAEGIREFINPHHKGAGWNAGNKAHIRNYLKDLALDEYQIAYVVIKTVINRWMAVDKSLALTDVAYKIVGALRANDDYAVFKKKNHWYLEILEMTSKYNKTAKKKTLNTIRIAANRYGQELSKIDEVKSKERIELAIKLLDILVESTGLFRVARESSKIDAPYLFIPLPEFEKFARENTALFASLQTEFPIMLIPPMEWSSVYDGGYYSPVGALKVPLVKTKRWAVRVLEKHPMDAVYQAVNNIQNVPWEINEKILDVLKALQTNMGEAKLAGLPPTNEIPLPIQPWGEYKDKAAYERYKEEHHDEWKSYLRYRDEVLEANARNVSKRIAVNRIMSLAEKYKSRPIWFPWTLDFRGRMYPMPGLLNPQGMDAAKGLLRFNEGVTLGDTGAYWLAIHGANCAGRDKLSFDDRIEWVEQNEEMILRCANDPLNNLEWADADDIDAPFCFLAFCFEWQRYRQEGSSMLTHLPIAMDGTCNGLQHLSAILRDTVGGAAVNLVPAAKPADIYREVQAKTIELIKAEMEVFQISTEVNEDSEKQFKCCYWWLDGNKITRSMVKRPTMTTPYGVSRHGIMEQVMPFTMECLAKHEAPIGLSKGILNVFIADKITEAIRQVVVAAPEAMKWLQDATKAALESQMGDRLPRISWVTPDTNFLAIQTYREQGVTRINTLMGKQRIQLTSLSDIKKLSAKNQLQGVAPNVIHSMDAAMAMMTINKLNQVGVGNLSFIHDSYATHAPHVPIMNQILRESFVKLYEDYDVLGLFKNYLEKNNPGVILSDVPTGGDLNISDVKHSKYFFA